VLKEDPEKYYHEIVKQLDAPEKVLLQVV